MFNLNLKNIYETEVLLILDFSYHKIWILYFLPTILKIISFSSKFIFFHLGGQYYTYFSY